MKKTTTCVLLVVLLFTTSIFTGIAETGNDLFYSESDPIQVVDGAGRKVSFSVPAQTVATSWGGGIDQYLLALGLGDRIAATNGKHPLDKLFFDPSSMPKVGKWALDKESLAEVSPDLFLHGAVIPEYLAGANQVGVRAYGMAFFTFEDVFKNLRDIGMLTGMEDRAEHVVDHCQSILDLVDTRVAGMDANKLPRVIVLGEKTGELASDLFTTVDTMVARAGGISCTPEEIAFKTETTIVGLETIFEWNPDVIFLQDSECELTVDGIMNDPVWANLTAVQNGDVYCIPCELDPWFKSNPACVLGTLYMSAMMHPELYTDIHMNDIAVRFYKEVYDLDLTLEDLGLI